ncbi:MAG: DUF1553 domain-containing protein, partial [Pirellulaceae bacterium]|nr:DUF1553 domain-containing protein [Pirellulaceae bacterium]
DYYRLAATFTKAIRTEKEFDLEPAENERRRQEYAQRLAQAQQQLDTIEAEQLPSALVKWLNSAAALPEASQWQLISVAPSSSAKTKFKALDDGSFLATGKAPAKEVLTFVLPSSVKQLAALRVEALADESLSRKGPGRASNGNFVLTNVAATIGLPAKAAKASKAAKESAVRWSSAEATHQQNSASLSVAASIDDDPASGWAVDGQIGRDQAAVFRLAEPLTVPDRSQVTIRLSFEHPNAQHVLGRIRLSTSGSQQAPLSLGVAGPGNSVVEALRTLRASSPPDDRAKLPTWIADHQSQWPVALDWFRGQHAPWQQASQELNKLKADGAAVKLNKVLVTSEGLPHLPHHADGRGFPHFYPVTHHLRRGDVTQKGEAVEPGYLQVLISKRDAPSDTAPVPDSDSKAAKPVMPARSALSYWLTDSQQGAGHLAARVMVNRLWQHHFGQGLVTTPNDFGTSGERPTHPELLDWLAIQLIDHDWRLKPIHKQIMLSSVYMQSADTQAVQSPAISTQTDARHLIDPDNKLWWRRVPRRLEAEAVRDAMLAVSGTLDDQMFGPGTMNQDMKRRSVYFFIKRSDLIPMMMLFDWPEHLVSIGARSTTTIAPQALMFMNSPQGRSYAEALADKVHSDSLPNLLPEAITAAYLRVFGRAPSDMELGQAVRFVQQQASLRGGDADRDQTHKHRQLAMADLCQMLLSSNEFMYIE